MNRIVLGALGALLLVGIGMFWLQGRAQVERGAPPPEPAGTAAADPDALPVAQLNGMRGPEPPEASELTREQRRFYRYDRNRDQRITRTEMLSTRTAAFKKLDTDGNNLLDFEEWAVATAVKFDAADSDRDHALTPVEFVRTAPKPVKKPACAC